MTETYVIHGCDTGPGSSGAPLLLDDGITVVGVHHGRTGDGNGEATRSDIILRSSSVAAIAK